MVAVAECKWNYVRQSRVVRHWVFKISIGPHHAKLRLRAAKDPISQRTLVFWSLPLLSAYRIFGYYSMYEWRAQDYTLRILRMFEGTLTLATDQLKQRNWTKKVQNRWWKVTAGPEADNIRLCISSIAFPCDSTLTLSTLGKIFSRRHIWNIFVLFFPKNRIWHFMQNVSNGDSLLEMSNLVFWKKIRKILPIYHLLKEW